MLKKRALYSLFGILIYLVFIVTVYKVNTFNNSLSYDKSVLNPSRSIDINYSEKSDYIKEEIGYLYIPKLNLKRNLFDINSPYNNIEENVTILKDSVLPNNNDDSIIFLAAHSGSGKNAFFDNLKYLEIQDDIFFNYNNNTYQYTVDRIEEADKNGYIYITRYSKNQIILTTCSDNKGKQLIIYGIRKSN